MIKSCVYIFIVLAFILLQKNSFSQCDPNTPSFNVNLTGSPGGNWISPWVIRDDNCCGGGSGNRNCVEFVVTLDSLAEGISMDIYDGAAPTGSLEYSVDCGPPVSIGTALCLSGVGPHIITFCKPGNNENQYVITSIASPFVTTTLAINNGCSSHINTGNYIESTVVWNSVFPGAIGDWNYYLDCQAACDTVTITSSDTLFPQFIDYEVCGNPIGGCGTLFICDTVRVEFSTTLVPTISPVSAILCPLDSGVTLSASVTGGYPPYSYQWTPSLETSTSIFAGVGTHTVIIVDQSDCPPASASAIITQITDTITTNAGPDRIACLDVVSVPLDGSYTGGLGAIWSGGNGVYSQSNVDTNALYFPTPAEIASGSMNLILTNTGTGICPVDSDTMTINFVPFEGINTITITNPSCFGSGNGQANISTVGITPSYSYNWNLPLVGIGPVIGNVTPGSYTVDVTDGNGCLTVESFVVADPIPLTSTFTQTNVSCFFGSNGQAAVTAYGGTPPYSYSWIGNTSTSDTAFNLSAGTYTAIVTDSNGCQDSTEIIITQPNVLSAFIIGWTDVSCFGGNDGTATVTISGGTPGYTFGWSPLGGNSQTAQGLIAGSYVITVQDSSGCQGLANVIISEPSAPLSAVITQTNVTCFGGNNGTINAVISGGTTPYASTTWSSGGTTPSISGLSAGNDTLTVIDANGCIYTEVVTITQPPELIVSPAFASSSCGMANGQISANVSGGYPGYSYLWDIDSITNIVTNIGVGTYSVTVTDDSNCVATGSITVTSASDPVIIDVTSFTDVSCFGGNDGTATVNVSSGNGGYSYAWSGPVPAGDSTTGINMIAGTYIITVVDINSCSDVDTVIISEPATAISITTNVTNVSCNGGNDGEVSAIGSGGIPGYTYSWNIVGTDSIISSLTTGQYEATVEDANGCIISEIVDVTQPTLLSLVLTATNVSCFGYNDGQIGATIAGGTPPFSYVWTGGLSVTDTAIDVVAGTYTVTVTDSLGCVIIDSVTITQPQPVTVLFNLTNVSCNGLTDGTADVIVTGGTQPYVYLWSNPVDNDSLINNVGAGNYTVAITDALGCQITDSVVISEPAVLSLAPGMLPVTCKGFTDGEAGVIVTGGTTPYFYNWNNGFATGDSLLGVPAGSYTGVVTDSLGCIDSVVVIVTEPIADLTLAITHTNVSCSGGNDGTATAIPAGGTLPYTFLWSGGMSINNALDTGLTAATYTVLLTDSNGCIAISPNSVTISQPTLLVSNIASITNASCNASSDGEAVISTSGGTAPYSYSWSPNVSTDSIAINLSAGSYAVTTTDALGCTDVDVAVVTDPALPLTSITNQLDNPCNGDALGIAIVTASGGTAPYEYLWSGGAIGTTDSLTNLTAGTYNVTVTDTNGCTTTNSVTIVDPTPLAISFTITNVSCNTGNDGQVVALASGGTPGYLYGWNNGDSTATISSLTAGSYQLNLTDTNGCLLTQVANVTQPPLLTLALSSTNVSCFGFNDGQAYGTVSGGTGPFTYSWSNGIAIDTINNLIAGTYVLTVTDALGCSVIDSVTITQPQPVAFNYNVTDITCFGLSNGQADVIVSGGTQPYIYLWNDPTNDTDSLITGVVAGTYSTTVTDAQGCVIVDSVTIVEPAIVTLSPGMLPVSCFGYSDGQASVTVTGGTSPYIYNWSQGGNSDSILNLVANSYEVVVTDNQGCADSIIINVTEPIAALTINFSHTDVNCFGDNDGTTTVIPSGGTSPYSYAWSSNPLTDTNALDTGLVAGTYTVLVTDANSCTAISPNSVTVAQPTQLISNIASITNVACSGVPTGQAIVSTSGGVAPYLYSWNNGGGTDSAAINLAAGTYTVTTTDALGCTDTDIAVITEPLLPLASATSQINNRCFGNNEGVATVSVTGGTVPYSYLWTGNGVGNASSLTNLSGGTYYVNITDSLGCIALDTVVILEPDEVIFTPTSVLATCGNPNGELHITFTGGTAPYTYQWNPGAVASLDLLNIVAGVYSFTVIDDSACVDSILVPLQEIVGAEVTITVDDITNVLCYGDSSGSVSASFTGGIGTILYAWSSGGVHIDSALTINSLPIGTYIFTTTDSNNCKGFGVAVIEQPDTIQTTLIGTDISCNGGSDGTAQVFVSGGVGGETYSWSSSPAITDSIGNIGAGIHTVTVTDTNGCIVTNSINLIEPPALTLTMSGTNINCFGLSDGTAIGTVTGGTPFTGGTESYTYSWLPSNSGTNDTIFGLPVGNYTVTATDNNGCQITDNILLTQPATGLTSTITGTNISCNAGNDGTATVTPLGGTAPFSYSWSSNPLVDTNALDINLPAGTYTVNITDDNGCFTNNIITLNQPTQLVSTITSYVNVSCNGFGDGSATVVTSGGNGTYSYLWDDAPTFQTTSTAINLTPNTYTVTTTDILGCTDSDTLLIIEPPTPLTVTTSQVSSPCFGDCDGVAIVQGFGGTNPYSYVWSGSANGTNDSLTGLCIGTYSILITDANGCTASGSETITQPTLLTVSSVITDVLCNGDSSGVVMASASGGVLPYSYSWNNGDLDSLNELLPAATYTVTVTDSNECITTLNSIVSQPNLLSSTMSTTNVSCNGGNDGEGIVTPTGGTLIYSYNWTATPLPEADSIANNLPAGSYPVDIVDTNGCAIINQADITEPIQLAVTYQWTDVSCNGGNNGTASALATGGTLSYSYLWVGSGVTSPSTSGLSAGWHVISVTDGNGCSYLDSVLISEPTPLVSTMNITNVNCNGGVDGEAEIIVTGGSGGYTYNWTSGSQSSISPGLSAGQYIVTVTDAHGCIISDTAFITQPLAPLSINIASSNVLCNGGTDGFATANVSGGTTPYSYDWSNLDTILTASNLIADNYVVNVVDFNGCTISDAVTIEEPYILVTNIVNVVEAYCGLPNGAALLTATGGEGPFTYLWNTPANDTTPDITGQNPGFYTVITTDANGCINTDTVTINNIAPPQVGITSQTNVSCFNGSNGTATAVGTFGTQPYIFSWSPSGNLTVNDTTSVANFLPVGTHVVTLLDANGCIVKDSVEITQPPVIDIVLDSIIAVNCFGEASGEAYTTVMGGTGSIAYSWSTVPAQNSNIATNLSVGAYVLTATDSLLCEVSTVVLIPQPPQLNASVNAFTDEVCIDAFDGTATVLVTGGTPAYTYVWTSTPIQTTITAVDLPPGTYQVFVEDDNGCVDTSLVTIGSPDPIITTAMSDNTICYGDSITLMASGSGGAGNYQYFWNNGIGLSNPATVGPLVETIYEVTAADQYGCLGTSDQVTVYVQAMFQQDLGVYANSPICPGTSTLLYASLNGANTGPVIYSWNPVLGDTAGAYVLYPSTPTTYVVTVSNQCGDTLTDSVFVDLKPLPTVDFSANIIEGCQPLVVQFSDLSTANTIGDNMGFWTWDFGDGGSSLDQNPTYTFENSGTFNILLTASTNAGCTNDSVQNSLITVFPNPIADFTTESTDYTSYDMEVQFVNESQGASFYEWDFGDGNTSVQENPINTYAESNVYTIDLIAVSDSGCKDTARLVLPIIRLFSFYVPNTFTPDGDGVNDFFFAYGDGMDENKFEMWIYNRWGELVFFSQKIENYWDGSYRNTADPAPDGTYIWVIKTPDTNGVMQTFNGHVNLLR